MLNKNDVFLFQLVDDLFSQAQSLPKITTSNCTVDFPGQYGYVEYPGSSAWPFSSHPDYWIKFQTIETPEKFVDVPSYPVSDAYILETGEMLVQLAITGYNKEDIKIYTEGDSLGVKATLQKEGNEKQKKKLFKRISIHDIDWKVRISNKYDLSKIKATCSKGILSITIPLKESMERKEVKID